jgi:hypothetical protein
MHDRNGTELKKGDIVLIEAEVTDLQPGADKDYCNVNIKPVKAGTVNGATPMIENFCTCTKFVTLSKRLPTIILIVLAVLCGAVGCQGGASSTLMTLDVIQQSMVQAKIGVKELTATALADAEQQKVNFLNTMRGDLKRLAAGAAKDQDPNAVADAGITSLKRFWENHDEQIRRINTISSNAQDNLDFADEQAGTQRQVVLYTSDIETQWKTWISNEATAKINKLKAQAAAIPATPGPTTAAASSTTAASLESLLLKYATKPATAKAAVPTTNPAK